MKLRLISLILALLILPSCTAEPALLLPEREYPIILTADITTELTQLSGILTVEEDGSAALVVTSPATIEGFTFTVNDAPTLSHGSVTAPLPASMPALEILAEILTLDEASILSAEPITLGGMTYNRVICGSASGEASFYLTAEGVFVRAECAGVTLDVTAGD